jgi:hypothetical protein
MKQDWQLFEACKRCPLLQQGRCEGRKGLPGAILIQCAKASWRKW